ncbi:uncharacterized protein LOC34624287 [Cyclospora cayetanensis]|uniref:Uncharacterized protein LOC34624287 n=1 Tax=Cyclospora cayetanensis TaxID=88456 RepID=A0A6P6RQ26_9EIME|nr:uncharacterized protein LOC34624287 [Cyclospora cayetanensis]
MRSRLRPLTEGNVAGRAAATLAAAAPANASAVQRSLAAGSPATAAATAAAVARAALTAARGRGPLRPKAAAFGTSLASPAASSARTPKGPRAASAAGPTGASASRARGSTRLPTAPARSSSSSAAASSGPTGHPAAESGSWLTRAIQSFVKCRGRQRQKVLQKERRKERIVRLPLGVSVALWAPIPSSSRLKRDVLLNTVAALLLFSASDVMAQHLQHTQAHAQQQTQQQEACAAEQVPPRLRSTLMQLDGGRTLAVGCEGVFVNALLLTPMYHKLEAMLAHNKPSLKRSSSSNPAGAGRSGAALAQRNVGAAVKVAAAAATATVQQQRNSSRMLWLMSLYQVLAVQIVAMPFSSFSFLFLTPILRFAFARLLEPQQEGEEDDSLGAHRPQQQPQPQPLAALPAVSEGRCAGKEAESEPGPKVVQQQVTEQQQQQRCWVRTPPPQSLSAAISEGTSAVSLHFKGIYVASLVVWPLSDLINFRFVPLALRPAWDSLLDFVWAVYLSYAAHSSPAHLQQELAALKGSAAVVAARESPLGPVS